MSRRGPDDRIRVLSLWRPWLATFFQAGLANPKRIENRSKPPPKSVIGTWIAFHAGQKFDYERMHLIRQHAPEVSLSPEDHPTGLVGMAFIEGYATSIDHVPDDGQRCWWLGPIAYFIPKVIPFDAEFRAKLYVPNRKTGALGPAPGQQGWKFLSDEHATLIRERYAEELR